MPGSISSYLQGAERVSAAGEVFDVVVYNRQQLGRQPLAKQGSKREHADWWIGDRLNAVASVAQHLASREGTPSAEMRQAELADVVREALAVLNEDQKLAVLLNKFEEMSYAEIADVMGRSPAAVKSLIGPGTQSASGAA